MEAAASESRTQLESERRARATAGHVNVSEVSGSFRQHFCDQRQLTGQSFQDALIQLTASGCWIEPGDPSSRERVELRIASANQVRSDAQTGGPLRDVRL